MTTSIIAKSPDIFNIVKAIEFPEIQQAFHGEEPRNGKVTCPFHDDRNPSLHIYHDGYKCFACGASGDGVSFVAQLHNIRPLEAARQIAERFGFPVDMPGPEARRQAAAMARERAREKELRESFDCYRWERFRTSMAITNLARRYIEENGLDSVDGDLLKLMHRLPILDYITEQLCKSPQAAAELMRDECFRGWAS